MSAPKYAKLAGRVLARHAPPVSPAAPSAQARLDAIEAIDAILVKRARARRVARWTALVAAVASVAGVFGVWRHEARGARVGIALEQPAEAPRAPPIVAYPLGAGASTWQGSTRVKLVEGERLVTGSRVETGQNGRAALAFASGTSAMLGESADLTVDGDDATQILRLDAGSVDLHVARVSIDHRFLVATPDAEVEVHGTKFRVTIAPADPACTEDAVTHLVVTEGVVVVRHGGVEKRIAAGEHWPNDCGSTPESAPAPAASAAPATGAQTVVSSLAEQNDLFAEAIVAKHHGDATSAVAAFDRFLTTYPTSPLAQSAAVERMRLLRSTSSARTVGAARQYLARYQNGFARAEAEAIVAGTR